MGCEVVISREVRRDGNLAVRRDRPDAGM